MLSGISEKSNMLKVLERSRAKIERQYIQERFYHTALNRPVIIRYLWIVISYHYVTTWFSSLMPCLFLT
jgi:hypothetical protein